MERGFTSRKRHAETPGERNRRLSEYAYNIKTYKADTKENAAARDNFKRPAYYTGAKQWEKKKDITE